MGKYGQALGFWNLKVGGADFNIKPKKGDNLKFLHVMSAGEKKKDQAFFMEQFSILIKEIIARDYPPVDDKEKEELDMFIEFNLAELLKETMIAFKWTTREKYDEIEKQQLGDMFLKKKED